MPEPDPELALGGRDRNHGEPKHGEPDHASESDEEPYDPEPVWWPSPTRRLAWTATLTLAATVLTFAMVSQAGSWPARYLDWLRSVATLGFLDGGADPRFFVIHATPAVCGTIMVAGAALALASIVAKTGLPDDRAMSEPPAWLAATGLTGIALLAWLTGTLEAAVSWFNGAVGTNVLPTVVVTPSVQAGGGPFAVTVALLHQLAFPALVLTVALTPATAWWWRHRWRYIAPQPPDGAEGHSVRLQSELFPLFVVGALIVELATDSFGASRLLLVDRRIGHWFDDRPANIATGLVLLVGAVAALRWVWDTIGSWLIRRSWEPEPADPEPATATPESDPDERDGGEPDGGELEPAERAGALWQRLKADRTARFAAALLAALAVAACYSQLWFDFRAIDIVSTETPEPPSARHWLGVDMFGHDHLVRLGAAVAGSAAIAAGAATLATVGGLALLVLAAWLPRRSSLLLADLAAIAAMVWLLGSSDPQVAHLGVSPVALAVTFGAAGLPLTVRLMSYRWDGSVAPVIEAWLVACAATVAAEVLATTLLAQLPDNAPTLGDTVAKLITGALAVDPLFFDLVASTWPWLWYPPALPTAVLATGLTLLAVVVLRGPDPGSD